MRELETLMVNGVNNIHFYGDSQVFIQWMAREVVGRNTYLNNLLKEENCLKGHFHNISLLETMESIYYSDPNPTHITSYRPNHLLSLMPSIFLKPLLYFEHNRTCPSPKTTTRILSARESSRYKILRKLDTLFSILYLQFFEVNLE